MLTSFIKLFRFIFNFEKHFFKNSSFLMKNSEIVFIYHDNDATQKYDKEYKSHILYPLELNFNQLGLTCTTVMTPLSLKNIYLGMENYYSYNLIYFISLVLRFPFELIGFKYTSRIIKKYVVFLYWLVIFKRVQPFLIIGIQPESGICMAANKLGISIADYQHGVISKEHPYYSKTHFLTCNPFELPSIFIVWNDYCESLLKDALGSSSKVSVLSLGKPKLPKSQAHEDSLQKLLSKINKYSCIVLVSLQPDLDSIRDDDQFNGLLLDGIVDAVRGTSDKDIFWLIRFHPSQLNSEVYIKTEEKLFEILGYSNHYEYEISSYLPLEILLDYCNLHITDYSSVVIEASHHGVKSAILNEFIKPGKKFESYYAYEIESKSADLVDNDCQSILRWISLNAAGSAGNKKIKAQNFNIAPLLDFTKIKQ